MTETIGADGKLHRNERLVAPTVESPAVPQHILHHRLAAGERQELVQDHPLIMPAHDALRLGERLAKVGELQLPGDVVDDRVVEAQEAEMQLRDDQVLVIARIADQRHRLTVPRHVELVRRAVRRDALDEEFDAAGGLVVEMRTGTRPGAVQIVEPEGRRAEIGDHFRVGLTFQARGRIERHVMVKELAEKGHSGAHLRIVGIVGRQRGIGDELHRSGGEVVLRVHDAVTLADIDQRLAQLRRVGGEGRQLAEQPTEAARRKIG